MSASLIGWLLGKTGVARADSSVMRWGRLVLGALLLLATPFAGWMAWTRFSEARESAQWPSTQGKVVAAEMKKGLGTKAKHTPAITYQYQVGGRSYQGNRTRIGNYEFSSDSEAQQYLSAYPVGGNVTVYYRSTDPSRSLLEVGATGGTYFLLLIPVILGGVGAFLVLSSRAGTVRAGTPTDRFAFRR